MNSAPDSGGNNFRCKKTARQFKHSSFGVSGFFALVQTGTKGREVLLVLESLTLPAQGDQSIFMRYKLYRKVVLIQLFWNDLLGNQTFCMHGELTLPPQQLPGGQNSSAAASLLKFRGCFIPSPPIRSQTPFSLSLSVAKAH